MVLEYWAASESGVGPKDHRSTLLWGHTGEESEYFEYPCSQHAPWDDPDLKTGYYYPFRPLYGLHWSSAKVLQGPGDLPALYFLYLLTLEAHQNPNKLPGARGVYSILLVWETSSGPPSILSLVVAPTVNVKQSWVCP